MTVLGVLVATVLLWPDRAPGHYRTAAGRDEYLRAYARAMLELPPPDATLDLRTSFGVVRVYRFASPFPQRDPLLLLPGQSSGVPAWEANLRLFQAERDVYALDLLGDAGLSVQDTPMRGAGDAARWLHEVVQQLPVERVHLVGLSIGGWSAANLAVRHPQKLASVSLVEPIMTFTDLSPGMVLASIPASVPLVPVGWRNRFLSWISGDVPVERGHPVGDLIEAAMRTHRSQQPTPTRITEDQLRQLDLPVLGVMAGRSRVHDSAEAMTNGERALRRGTMLLYPNASHAVNGEYAEQLCADILAFAARS